MQLLIDTAADSLADIRAAIMVLGATIQERMPQALPPTNLTPPAPPVPDAPPPPPPPADPSVFAANAAPVAIPPPPSVAASTPGDASAATPNSDPTPPPATMSASPSDAKLDSAGVAWNPAQHSTPAKLNVDGTWRARRNVTKGKAPAEPAQVPLPPTDAPMAAAAGPAPVVAGPVIPPPPVALPPAPADGAPPAAPVAPVPAGDGALDFRGLMQRITAGIAAKKLQNEQVPEICAAIGVPSLLALQQQPAKILEAAAFLQTRFAA
jgi:hypothetical protein